MAKQVVVQLIDDLDQEPIEGDGEHIEFAVNGIEYAIDLKPENAMKFHDTIGYYIGFATRTTPARPRKSAPSSVHETAAIRAWARDNGYDVSGRGRIPARVRAAYTAAAR